MTPRPVPPDQIKSLPLSIGIEEGRGGSRTDPPRRRRLRKPRRSSWAPLLFSVQKGTVRYNVDVQKFSFASYEVHIRFVPASTPGSRGSEPLHYLGRRSWLGPVNLMAYSKNSAARKAKSLIAAHAANKGRSRVFTVPVAVRAPSR